MGRRDGPGIVWTWSHEDIPWTRGRSGRKAREGSSGRCQIRSDRRAAGPSGPRPGPTGFCAGSVRFQPAAALVPSGHYPENKSAADIITWRVFEALRNEMRREFHAQDDVLNGKVEEINQKLDATNTTVTTMADQMTDIQRTLRTLTMSVENLNQHRQQHEDADEAPGRGDRVRGWAPLGRNGRGQDEEDGLGKPKFSIPKFEGGADVEEYLTWELKIEKLWGLHPHYTEDRKIKLASSEFDGYALRWWDRYVSAREEDGELSIITWRAMKAAMTERFVPTNYLRNIFDKLTLLRQGVKTVDEYYMEMEMLMQRGRVKESLEMTMTRFLNGLEYDIKGIVLHYSYNTMNELLHHAREAESQLADEAKIKRRATGAGRFTPRAVIRPKQIQLSGKSSEFMRKGLFYQNIDGARRAREVEARGPHTIWRRGPGGPRGHVVWPLGRPPTPRTTYWFRQTHGEKSKSRNPPESRHIAKLRRGSRKSPFGTPPDGELEEIFTAITANASPSTSNVSPSMCE
ncbi:hypothetical protein QYE76_007331 [Lolium multiflorum]|uniref:Retrotransposon gag domain-containing protein n=1 Tax=Lolium multiflorum TaxID=4521 RepID=A0AAD8W581_LOLMU|nr:hypothetical protein QYE76_007331 [Lolium multiflorum]